MYKIYNIIDLFIFIQKQNYNEIVQQIKKMKRENKLLEMENEVGLKYLSGISLK